MKPISLAVVIAAAVLAGCGGSPAQAPPPVSQPAQALGGLGRAVGAAHRAVAQSQQDAQRAAGTTTGG